MTTERIYNFNPGPAALPLVVLEEIQENFLNFKRSGMSITEISHRSKEFDDVINDAVVRTKRLLNLGDNFQVLFIQGGASMQFCMIPMNFLSTGKSADYVDTGTWSTKAIKEAEIQGKSINVVASSADRNYCYIPQDIPFNNNAAFVHLTSNNTIKGTQWAGFPDTKRGAHILRYVVRYYEPTAGCCKIRADLCRRTKKCRAGRYMSGNHPQRHPGSGARFGTDHVKIYHLFR